MPAIGSGGFKPQAPLPKPKPPSIGRGAVAGIRSVAPPPPPSPSSAVAAVSKAAGKGARNVARTTSKASRAAGKATSTVGRRTASQGSRAATQAAGAKYQRALIALFVHQSPSQQQAIIKGAQATPGAYESKVLFGYLRSMERMPNLAGAPIAERGVGPAGIQSITDVPGQGEHLLSGAGTAASALINKIPTYKTSGQQLATSAEGIPAPGEVTKNFAKDFANLPAEAVSSVSVPVSDLLHGHYAAAANTFIKPYEQLLKHPGQSLLNHPLNSYLMTMGVAHPTAALAEEAGRAILRKPLNRVPESVHLTGNLTHERPLKSKSFIMRQMGPVAGIPGGQDFLEGLRYGRNARGELVPKSANVRARMIKLETSRLVGENERVRVVGHQEQAAAHADAFIRGRANPGSHTAGARRVERTVHATKTALQFDPKAPLVKGSEIAGLAARRILRRPETAVADFEKYLAIVESNRHNLVDNPKLLKIADDTIAKLRKALPKVRKMSRADWNRLFSLTDRYRREYKPLERQARDLGHYRDMTPEALVRRELMDATLLHMPGARFDREQGMVRDLANGDTHPLSTDRMEQFVRQETGGKLPAYVPNRTLEGDRAHFVSGQSRPYPVKEGNTGFALLHGLVEPSHEALLENRVRLRGVIDSHHSNNRLDQQLVVTRTNNKPWQTYNEAKAAAPDGYRPIRLAKQFHPQGSLDEAIKGVDFASLIEEADRRSLDINRRLAQPEDPNAKSGAWGLIDNHAANQLLQHEKLIGPNTFLRSFKGLTAQFRQVALATSFRHLPGVTQEILIRSMASGVGPISWLAGRGATRAARELNPELGRAKAIHLKGGTVTGQALSLRTRQVSPHFEGTLLHGPLSVSEKFMRAPGLRQTGYLWRAWRHFTLDGTKRFLEEQAQTGAIGRQVIDEFGGGHGLLAKALGQWGTMIDKASHGILDESTARRFRVTINRIYGRWTDLTPGEQTALMFSPFGMWWTNSVAWLARLPIDHPALTGAMAALNTGTEKQRQKAGLDLFAPGMLPLYLQGSVPLSGGRLLQANYYSPVGVANDPLGTLESLTEPWLLTDLVLPALGKNWHGGDISSPQNPYGYTKLSEGEKLKDSLIVIFNSLASSFIPLYQKAQTVVQGGSTAYDTSSLPNPQTKTPPGSLLQGLEKATSPLKIGKTPASSSSSSNPWGAPAGSSSSKNPWG